MGGKVDQAVDYGKKALGATTTGGVDSTIGGAAMGPLGTILGSYFGGKQGYDAGGFAGLPTLGTFMGQGSRPSVDTAGPRPDMPGFKSILDASGAVAGPYRYGGAGLYNPAMLNRDLLAPNEDALNKLKSIGMSTGDTDWLKLQKQNLAEQTQAAGDKLGANANTEGAVARSQLAMRGGLTGGAAERIAMNQGRDLSASQQGLARDTQSNLTNLNIADQGNKMNILGQLPGMDLANANYKAGLQEFNTNTSNDANKFNIGQMADINKTNMNNSMLGLNAQNQFNLKKYGEDMKGYAAAKQGDAIANAGKNGK